MVDNCQKSSLEELKSKLEKMETRHERQQINTRDRQGFGFAIRIGVDIVAALAVGVGIGLLLDNWLNTKPLMLIIFFIMGSAAGVLNVFRSVRGFDYSVGYSDLKKDDSNSGNFNDHVGNR